VVCGDAQQVLARVEVRYINLPYTTSNKGPLGPFSTERIIMNVRELIELLQQEDHDKEVKIPSPTGGYKPVNDVSSEIERDPFDGDWDKSIVVVN